MERYKIYKTWKYFIENKTNERYLFVKYIVFIVFNNCLSSFYKIVDAILVELCFCWKKFEVVFDWLHSQLLLSFKFPFETGTDENPEEPSQENMMGIGGFFPYICFLVALIHSTTFLFHSVSSSGWLNCNVWPNS